MNILVLIHEYPPVGGGGGPIARDLSLQWVKEGHRVRVVTSKFAQFPDSEIDQGVEVIRLSSHRTEMFRADFKAMGCFILASLKYLFFQCKDFAPDIVHVHFAVPNGPIALLYSKIKKIPYVLTAHLGDIPGASPEKTAKWFRFVKPFTPPIWKNAARVAAVSEFSKRMALPSYSVLIEVIKNGVDYERIKNNNLKVYEPVQIVFAGRFVPQKNLDQIVETLANLKDFAWHCTLIGDGQDREHIEGEIQKREMTERFTITGWKKPDEVMEIFKNSDILFLPSKSEGLPVVGIQAMACGLALVLSRAGGNPEIIQEGENGRSCEWDDTEGFVRVLSELLSDKDKILSYKQKSLILAADYDIKKSADAYLALFNDVLAKGN